MTVYGNKTKIKLKNHCIMKKKLWLIAALAVCIFAGARAQSVTSYGFADSVGTYTELSGATVLATPETLTAVAGYYFLADTACDWANTGLGYEETAIEDAFPIGFDFYFHGEVFDKFLPMGIGYIVLGSKDEATLTLPRTTAYNVRSFLDNAIGVAADMPVSATEKTSVSYLLTGSEGSRELTVQYKNLYYESSGGGWNDSVNYQIILREADSSITLVFGDMVSTSSNTWFTIGVRGEGTSERHFRRPVSDDWTETEMATTGTGFAGENFPKGTTYVWTLPPACEQPHMVFPDLFVTSVASDGFEVEVNRGLADGYADGFLLALSEGEELAVDVPQKGVVYEEGDTLPGGYKVLYSDLFSESSSSFDLSVPGLKPNTTYYVNIWGYNSICSGGPVYSDNVSSVEASTLTDPPVSLKIAGYSEDAITLSATPNASNEEMLVLMTTVLGTDNLNNRILVGDFGLPHGTYEVGDTVWKDEAKSQFGGLVIYKGGATDQILAENLTDNTIYHFAAFSCRESDQSYSSLFAQADTVTPAKVPFTGKFETMPTYRVPYGWTSPEGKWQVGYDRMSQTGNLTLRPETNDTNTLVTPKIRFPETKDVRMIFNYGATIWEMYSSRGLRPSDWGEGDYFAFEASTDGVVFEPFYTITRSNADDFTSASTVDRNFSLQGYQGQEVYIRMRLVSNFSGTVDFSVNRFDLIEVPDCDYPARVAVIDSTILGDQAMVAWESGLSDESAWRLSYGLVNGEGVVDEWIEEGEIHENPYLLEGLAFGQPYQVRVRAVCGVGSESDWTVSSTFYSGFGMPLMEDFNNLPVSSGGWRPTPILNAGWSETYNSEIADTIDLSEARWTEGNEVFELLEWKGQYPALADYGVENGSAAFSFSSYDNGWLLLPPLVFEEGSSAVLEFSASMIDEMTMEATTGLGAGSALYVLPSYDGGNTFYMKDTLKVFDTARLHAIGDSSRFSIPLSELDGSVRLAFFCTPALTSESSLVRYQTLYLDDISVYAPCMPVAGLEVPRSELRDTSALLTWNANPLVENYIVKLEQGETVEFFNTEENRYLLTGLEPQTAYVAGVSYECEGDTLPYATVSFTTGGDECLPPSGLNVDEVERNAAVLSWEGEAGSYRLRIRPVQEPAVEWVYRDEVASPYRADNLLAGTEYEWGVQSRCGEGVMDTSAFVAGQNFTTLDITCFPPEGLKVVSTTHNSATLEWEGTADQYQYAYRLAGGPAFILGEVVSAAEAVASGLLPESEYEFRVRSICAAGDTSAWSSVATGYTGIVPACPEPTNLRSESITETSALLKWDVEESVSCILRYRESLGTTYDSVEGLTATEHELTGLQPNTAYIWQVKNLCTEDRVSGWAYEDMFTTSVDNEALAEAGFKVYATRGQLHLLNPQECYIEKIELYDRGGKLAQAFSIRADGNVIVRTDLRNCPVVVSVLLGQGQRVTYKVFLP